MDLLTQFERLEERTSAGLAEVQSAATESREALEQRIEQAQVDLGEADAKQQVGGATPDQSQNKWTQMRADASAKMDDIKAKIDKRNAQVDADMAAADADFAEAEASDAIGYAEWVVDSARLAVLDAMDARAYAFQRAEATARNP